MYPRVKTTALPATADLPDWLRREIASQAPTAPLPVVTPLLAARYPTPPIEPALPDTDPYRATSGPHRCVHCQARRVTHVRPLAHELLCREWARLCKICCDRMRDAVAFAVRSRTERGEQVNARDLAYDLSLVLLGPSVMKA